jgi:hypothetical protein
MCLRDRSAAGIRQHSVVSGVVQAVVLDKPAIVRAEIIIKVCILLATFPEEDSPQWKDAPLASDDVKARLAKVSWVPSA